MAPGSKNGFWLVVTSEAGTVKVLAISIASSRKNLSAHLSSNCFRSSAEGLLQVDFFLLAEGLGDSLCFVFFAVGVDCGCEALSFSIIPSTLTCAGSTRVGAEVDAVTFFSFRSLYVGVANCCTCSGVNPLQTPHSFLRTQG